VYSILDVYAHTYLFFSPIMIDLPHVEDFVLQLEKNVRLKKARCSKFPSIGKQTTQITSPAFCKFEYFSFDLAKAWLGLYRLYYLCL